MSSKSKSQDKSKHKTGRYEETSDCGWSHTLQASNFFLKEWDDLIYAHNCQTHAHLEK